MVSGRTRRLYVVVRNGIIAIVAVKSDEGDILSTREGVVADGVIARPAIQIDVIEKACRNKCVTRDLIGEVGAVVGGVGANATLILNGINGIGEGVGERIVDISAIGGGDGDGVRARDESSVSVIESEAVGEGASAQTDSAARGCEGKIGAVGNTEHPCQIEGLPGAVLDRAVDVGAERIGEGGKNLRRGDHKLIFYGITIGIGRGDGEAVRPVNKIVAKEYGAPQL